MFHVIHKYPLPIAQLTPDLHTRISITMPVGSVILSLQLQREVPVLWARVSPTALPELRWFFVAATGLALPQGLGQFVDTFQLLGGHYVLHLYEYGPPT